MSWEYIDLNPIEAVTSVFRNYVNFNGRAQRSEFWWFVLFSFVSQFILNFVPIIGSIYSLVLLLPSLAVTARRLHDTDRTAWWMLLYLIPILGFIILVILFFALLGINVFDPWRASDAEWGVLGLFFLVWLLGSIAAWVVLLVFQIMPGTVGPNRYGPDPLRLDPTAHAYSSGIPDSAPNYAPPPPGGGYTAGAEQMPRDAPADDQDPGAGQRRYCTQCGMQLQSTARFCTYCGAAA